MNQPQTPKVEASPDMPLGRLLGEVVLVLLLVPLMVAFFFHVRAVTGEDTAVQAGEFSPDGSRVAIASETGNAVFDVAGGGVAFHMDGGVSALAYSNGGGLLAASEPGGSIRLLDAQSGEEQLTLEGHDVRIASIEFSPDDSRVVAFAYDGRFAVWELPSGRRLQRISAGPQDNYAASFVLGGSHVITGGDAAPVRAHRLVIWDVSTGLATGSMTGPEYCYVKDFAVAADGRTVAVGLSVPTFRLWDVQSGEVLQTLSAHGGDGVQFGQHESLLLASSHGAVSVCDPARGTVQKMGQFVGGVVAAKQLGDGKVVTLDAGGELARWDAASGAEVSRSVGFTLRTWPYHTGLLVAISAWLVLWIGWQSYVRSVSPADIRTTVLLPVVVGLAVAFGQMEAVSAYRLAGGEIGMHGTALVVFAVAVILASANLFTGAGVPRRWRMLTRVVTWQIAFGATAYQATAVLNAMASAG